MWVEHNKSRKRHKSRDSYMDRSAGWRKQKVVSYPSVTLPAGLDWKKNPWLSPTLPNIPAGNYAWHAVLKNTTSGSIISESISPWTFVSAAKEGSTVEIGTIFQEEYEELDFVR